jgi:hypothetical protein
MHWLFMPYGKDDGLMDIGLPLLFFLTLTKSLSWSIGPEQMGLKINK